MSTSENVFTFLGLDADHRPQGKVVQLVKHFDEVPASKKTWPMLGQVKKDGVYALIVADENKVGVFGRTGKKLSNTALIPGLERTPEGVFIAELCLPGRSLEQLSGYVNPNRKEDLADEDREHFIQNAEFHVHDYLTLDEFISGVSDRGYTDRMGLARDLGVPTLDYTILADEGAADRFAEQAISQGEEGVVLKHPHAEWVAGHKGFRAMKKVRHIEYDLLCVGVEEGKGKYKGKVANLIFQWRDGQTLKAMLGKSYTHEDAKRMWEEYQNSVLEGDCAIHHIFTVYGLQDSSKGKIRLPKVGQLRHDKDTPDY